MTIQAPIYKPITDEDVAWLGTGPIPTKPYYDPDWFEAERQAIFLRSWMMVGHVCELPEPGSFIRRELEFAKASILIARGKDGRIRAFHNVCTHRGTRLVEDEGGKANAFLCPYHFWNFGLEGQLLAAPDFDRFHSTKKACALPKVAVDVCAGMIFVNLDPQPSQSLQEFLGPLAEQMATVPVAKATTFSEYVYEVEANWKLVYDNFQESYHLRFIHPKTGNASYNPALNAFGYPARYDFHGPHRTQRIWSNPAPSIRPVEGFVFGRAAALAAKDGLAGPHDRTYFAVFPSLFMLGTSSQNFSHVVYPISATRSRGVIRIYWVGADDSANRRFTREAVMALVRDVHAEDIGVIRRGQQGLNSGALKHMNFQAMEALCRHLFNEVDARVRAWRAERAAAGECA